MSSDRVLFKEGTLEGYPLTLGSFANFIRYLQCQFSHWYSSDFSHCIRVLINFSYRKSHQPVCHVAQPGSPSSYRDSVSKLTERVNAARYQQSRPRAFSAFTEPQDVISAAEKTYKDALREAEALLQCEPDHKINAVGDKDWIETRWEWIEVCEQTLVGTGMMCG